MEQNVLTTTTHQRLQPPAGRCHSLRIEELRCRYVHSERSTFDLLRRISVTVDSILSVPLFCPAMPPSQLVIRNRQTVPENVEGHSTSASSKLVEIKHPGYPAPVNDLITLRAYDSLDGCIHHETARIACGIISGNRWDGYFTETSDGPPLAISSAGLLPAGVYYFQVPRPLGTCRSQTNFQYYT